MRASPSPNSGSSGLVALPLVGPLEAVGKSPGELASAITEALAPEYLRNPRVSEEVLQYRPFFILGEVKAPGSYPYADDVNVRRAAALAGG
jgi:polysaccharide export outer membrane protein